PAPASRAAPRPPTVAGAASAPGATAAVITSSARPRNATTAPSPLTPAATPPVTSARAAAAAPPTRTRAPTTCAMRPARARTPPGDDRLTVKGDITPPPNPPLDPIADGLRLVLRDSPDGVFLDVTLPPGAYSVATRTGWKVRGTGFDFVTPQVVGGAVKAAHLRRPASLPGVVRVAISGKGGSYVTGVITPPLEVSVVVGPAGGQC